MPTVSVDGSSFIIGNQRHWIVGGLVGYAGLPASACEQRLLTAKAAGLNTVVVPVVWSQHERSKSRFSFDQDDNVAQFIQLAGSLGLAVIVRIGPVATSDRSLGGMPAWLQRELDPEDSLRSDAPKFLKRVAKWFSSLGKHIAHLQTTQAPSSEYSNNHPIIAIQVEHGWSSGDAELSEAYLTKLQRYAREGGFSVPFIANNNLFARADGDIEGWPGYGDLYAVTQQMRAGLRFQPPIISDLQLGMVSAWGVDALNHKSSEQCALALAEVLAAGGQYIIGDFGQSLRTGFSAARLDHGRSQFATTASLGGIMTDDGLPGYQSDQFDSVRRVNLFASSFSRVLSNLNFDSHVPTISTASILGNIQNQRTGQRGPVAGGVGPIVLSCTGSAGTVSFIMNSPNTKKTTSFDLVLSDGTSVPVEMKEHLRWILHGVHLFGNKHLDFCTLSSLARVGDMFVCFGAAGMSGTIQINGTPLSLNVPKGKSPKIEILEGVTVIVLNESQASGLLVEDDAIVLNASGRTPEGEYVPFASGQPERLQAGMRRDNAERVQHASTAEQPSLTGWEKASETSWVSGKDPRYARIDGPAPLHALGIDQGYAWVRAEFNQGVASRARHSIPDSGDRVHLFVDGSPAALLGEGPGIDQVQPHIANLILKKGQRSLTMLVDDLGRSARPDADNRKGVWGDLHEIKPLKSSTEVVEGEQLDLLQFTRPFFDIHQGERTNAYRAHWKFMHRKKSPVIVLSSELEWTGAILMNGEVLRTFVPGDALKLSVPEDLLLRGNNSIEIATLCTDEQFDEMWPLLQKRVSLFESIKNVTHKATWSLGSWTQPREASYEPLKKSAMTSTASKTYRGTPAWFRTSFDAPDRRRVMLHTTGMSKGHIFVNNHDLGRYFNGTPDGKPLPSQHPLWIPSSWLKEAKNQLVLFDEHGFPPSKVKLVAT